MHCRKGKGPVTVFSRNFSLRVEVCRLSLFTWQGALARRSSTALLSHKAKASGTARNSTVAASGGGWNQHEGLRGDEVTARASQEPVARSCA